MKAFAMAMLLVLLLLEGLVFRSAKFGGWHVPLFQDPPAYGYWPPEWILPRYCRIWSDYTKSLNTNEEFGPPLNKADFRRRQQMRAQYNKRCAAPGWEI